MLVFCSLMLFGQTRDKAPESTVVIGQDTAKAKGNSFLKVFRGNPGRAALYSAIIPSAGQIYNRKWWKVPIALSIDGILLYNLVYNSNEYSRYNKIFETLVGGGMDPDWSSAAEVKLFRDKYRAQKELGALYFAIGHIVTIFDAYVDRHLIEFDTSEDVSLKYFPSQNPFNTPTFGIAIALR